MSEIHTRFSIAYDDGDKIYFEVNRIDFFKYLDLVEPPATDVFYTTSNEWDYRIWFFDGLVAFIADNGKQSSSENIFMADEGIKTLAQNIISDGYDFFSIFTW